jgi:phage tail-like protein
MAFTGSEIFIPFNFEVRFEEVWLTGQIGEAIELCRGEFSEVSGLEATLEPKVIKEGGWNYGAHQRVGPVTFGTVVLKRGITRGAHLWRWFEFVSRGAYSQRMHVTITLWNHFQEPVGGWKLLNALPVKFKTADLNARGNEVGIEELHLAHEGILRV